MQIVINISKKTYKEIQERNIITCGETFAKDLVRRIRNGTPLPEHHGRLIDISEYEKYFNTAITYDDGDHKHVVYTNTIPTIIEGVIANDR